MIENALCPAAIAGLEGLTLSMSNTWPINGESTRRQRPLDPSTKTGALVLHQLNLCMLQCQQRVDDVQVLCSMPECERQRAHRDYRPDECADGRCALLAAFCEGTYVWVAPRSHQCQSLAPDRFTLCRLPIRRGAVLLIDAGLVHAGAAADCPPRVHGFSLPLRRDRTSRGATSARGPWHARSDFGDGL